MKNASLVYPLTSGLRKSLLNDVFTVRGDLFDLDLNFANNSVPDGLFSVSRASSVTINNATGQIETVGSNDWGIDHDEDGNPLGLPIFETRTNIALYSEQIGTAPWSADRTTVSANAATAPDGTATADHLIEGSQAGLPHGRAQTITITANTTHAVSIFVKAGLRFRGYLGFYSGADGFYVNYNLTAGTVTAVTVGGTATAGISGIQEYADGWYRVYMTGKTNAASTTALLNVYMLDENGSLFYNGIVTSDYGLYPWGVQVEACLGAPGFPTSYIPTTTTATTRAQEVPLISDIASFYNFSQGTFLVEATIPYLTTPVGVYFTIGDGVATDYMAVAVRTDVDNSLRGLVVDSGVIQADITDGTPIVAGTTKKIAFAYALNDFVMYEDGTSRGTDAAGTPLTAVDRLAIGTFDGGSLPLNGWIKRLRYSKTRLSNDNIAGLTS
jgi:hypothetical protein